MILKLAKLAAVPVAAAALTLAAAPAAPAATGPHIYSSEQAGYAAYNAHFRYIEESFTLPNAAAYAANVNAFGISVQLRSFEIVAVLSVSNTTTNTPWHGAVKVFGQSSRQLIHSNTNSPPMAAGDVVDEQIFYNRFTGLLSFRLSDITARTSFSDTYQAAPGELFFQARAGAEFGDTPWSTAIPYTAPPAETHLVTLPGITLTSYSGHRDNWSSWWTHAKIIMTRNGLSTGAVNVRPHNLWKNGNRFGVWLQP
jgi:hypothetical protein